MIPTFNSNALASSVSGTVPSGQTVRADAELVFKGLDSIDKGSAATGGQQAAVVNISSEGAQRAGAAQGSDGNGKVTAQKTDAAATQAPAANAQTQNQTQGATQAATNSASLSNSSKTYDPADTDQDGTVSPQEREAYDAKLAAQKAAEKAAGNGHSTEANAALKAYAAVNQLGKNGGSAAA